MVCLNKNIRQFGWRMKFKTLFMSDEEQICHSFWYVQFLAPGGLSGKCVQISVM